MVAAGPDTLFGRIRESLARTAAGDALVFLDGTLGATTWTGRELLDQVRDLQARFDALALAPKAPIGLLLRSQRAQTVHFLAALACDLVPAILAPPNPRFNQEYYRQTIRALVEHGGFAALVSDCDLPFCAVPVARAWTIAPEHDVAPTRRRASVQIGDAAFLQFSSGTTGIKRGVAIADAAALSQIDTYARAIDLSPDDRIVSWLPLYHDMGFVTALLMPLAVGCCSVMIEPLDWVMRPALWPLAATRYRGTLAWHPNFAFAFMVDRLSDADGAAIDLSSVRGLVNCSEPVTFESQDRFARRFTRRGFRPEAFWGCYAMAETTFALTHGTATDAGYYDPYGPHDPIGRAGTGPFVSVGRPIDGAAITVVASDGTPLPDRRIGELWVSSPSIMTAYHRSPEATRAAFAGDRYRTGDLGYRVGDTFFVTGRAKDLLIVGGLNVYPQDVEAVACSVAGVHPGRAAAFARFDAALQTEAIVVVAEHDVRVEETAALATRVRQALVSAFQVAAFEVHLVPPGWLIKSTAGKVARRLTQEKWQAQAMLRDATHAEVQRAHASASGRAR